MIRNIIYAICGFGSLSMLLFAAPSGALLTGAPEKGKVTTDPNGNQTVRGTARPIFIWLGGGYHGGK